MVVRESFRYLARIYRLFDATHKWERIGLIARQLKLIHLEKKLRITGINSYTHNIKVINKVRFHHLNDKYSLAIVAPTALHIASVKSQPNIDTEKKMSDALEQALEAAFTEATHRYQDRGDRKSVV